MEDVELVEVGTVSGTGEDRGPRVHLRPLLRRWWPVAVVVVLAVTATSVVLDARQRAALARVRELPGVLTTTVEPPLEAVEWGTVETVGALYSGMRTADGLVVGPIWPLPGEPAAVVALDPESGVERWRVDVEDRPDDYSAGLDCAGDGEPATTAWCLVSSGASRRMVEVDLVERAVRSTLPLPDDAAATVSGGTLFVTRTAADGAEVGVEVVATGLADGTQRWLTRVPGTADDATQQPWIWLNGGHLWVFTAAGQWSLDPADGSVEAEGASVSLTRGDRLVTDLGSAVTRLLGRDGDPDVELPGMPLDALPDDGSAPDVLVLQGADGVRQVVRGVDARTGRELWQRPSSTQTWPSVLLLDGVVYGAGTATVWAVDAETGRERWSVGTGSNGAANLLTDGLRVLQVEIVPEGRRLVAYGLRDGVRAWSEPLPEGADWVQELGGMLVVTSHDGVLRVLR